MDRIAYMRAEVAGLEENIGLCEKALCFIQGDRWALESPGALVRSALWFDRDKGVFWISIAAAVATFFLVGFW